MAAITPTLVTDQVTRPVYLVELGFRLPMHLSSGVDGDWDGKDWLSAPVTVSELVTDATGNAALTLTFANHDLIYGALILSEPVDDIPIKVWITYLEVNDDFAEPILLMDGFKDGAEIGASVNLHVVSRTTRYGTSPRVICAPPLMNHLPTSGTVLMSGNVRYEINTR